MKYLIILTVALLQACVNVPKQEPTKITQQLDSSGRVMSETRVESASVASDREIELTRRNCMAAESVRYGAVQDATAQVALEAIRALRPTDPCAASTNSNDVTIAANEQRTQQVGTLAGIIPLAGGIAGGAYVGGEVAKNRDATVVTQPAPLVVEQPEPILVEVPGEPVVIEPFIVNPVVITTPSDP